ncbi:MAG: trypsin-like peptidase domain-containing protein [Vicinamibacteria bacterium]|nr:trypsin-like peptidase domain-containing protein [Vicinamibacteria bacterium]
MTRAAALLFAACAAAAAGQAPPATPGDASTVFATASPSVVVVLALDAAGTVTGQGSGVVVAPGLVVTNRHVVQGATSVRLQQAGRTRTAHVLEQHATHDLALLRAPLKAPPASIRASKELAVGERVFAIGAPQGLELSISDGLVAQLRPEAGSVRIQTTAAISPGSSGGGLFDERGALVGITSYSALRGQNLNFALPTEWFEPLLRSAQGRAAVPTRVLMRPERRTGATRIVIEGDGAPLRYAWRSSDARGAVLELEDVDASAVDTHVDVGSAEVEHVLVETLEQDGRQVTRFEFCLMAPMRQRVYPEGANLNLVFERVPPVAAANPSPAASPEPPSPASSAATPTAPPAPGRLAAVQVETEDGGAAVWLATGPGAAFRDFVLRGPERIVIDLLGFTAAVRAATGAAAIVERVRIARHSLTPPVVRVVLDLARPALHTVSAEGDGLRVRLTPAP